MRRERHHVAAASYEVGYRKPPIHSRFKPGTSGNPRGRPRGRPLKRVDAMLVEELYRLVKVVDGETSQQVPVIQAIIRSLMLQAAKGNSPARRAALQLLQAMQGYLDAAAAQTQAARDETTALSTVELARRVAFLLSLGGQIQDGSLIEPTTPQK